MVKVSKIKYKGEDRHLETLKKTFLAMAKDLRVIFVKLADRIHNIQTLYFHPNPVKRQKIAQETMKIFVAIAKRLGLYHYQLYLENGSFKVLHEDAFNKIFSYLKKYFGDGDKYTAKGTKILANLLMKEGIEHFEVKGRSKSPYRVYEKLAHKYEGKEIGDIMDLLAFRVITKDIGDCYMALGIIHKHYTPVIKKIKDYIAVPKINGYKSIHTTIL
jgi:GTP pyrophosphokinase